MQQKNPTNIEDFFLIHYPKDVGASLSELVNNWYLYCLVNKVINVFDA